MARTPESSFGSKIAKAQQLLDYIRSLKDYNPPSEHLKVESLAKILDKANEANKQIVSSSNLLSQARINRNEVYYGDKGLRFRCAMIRDFVGILPTGKASSAYISIQKEVQKINNYKKSPKKEETTAEGGQEVKRTISRAETGFGSVLQSLKNILEIIKNIPVYAPTNDSITIEAFTEYIKTVESANQSVNLYLYPYNEAVTKRLELYEGNEGLRFTFQSIKTFIAAHYGKSSPEFKEVSKIKY